MSSYPLLLLLFLFLQCPFAEAQVSYTANDTILPYAGPFRFGSNVGAYQNWRDEQLADIAAGNPELGVEGIGVDAFRPLLSESFLNYWGYDIRLEAFQHYVKLGMKDNVVFIGYPAEEHRDPTRYCPDGPSELFANMYTPIWDNGENGTPVNDENYYALYLWEMVSRYHEYVRYWEIWNEPDFDFVGGSSLRPGEAGNWWEYDPDPCHYALRAPIEHYVRLLRISYEVIKTIAPDDYVALGGIGYPSFLDLILRKTDNPNGGVVDSLYPLRGGAYFDVVSFHSYPHIDNSTRAWSNEVNGFVYSRHSDQCLDGFLDRQARMRSVLEKYEYDGSVYPAKHWIVTESNIPRIEVEEYIGSSEAQRNYVMKALIACQQNEIDQFHIYQLGDVRLPGGNFSEYHSMGVFHPLSAAKPYQQQPYDIAFAYKTTAQLLKGKKHDPLQTARMTLPDGVRGGAFRDSAGDYTYVLWATTSLDRSEKASATYQFPASFNLQSLHQREWDFSKISITKVVNAANLQLDGSPRFFTDSRSDVPAEPDSTLHLAVSPNPFSAETQITLNLPTAMIADLRLYDLAGRLVFRYLSKEKLAEGRHQISISGDQLPAGVYLLYFESANEGRLVKKVIKR